MAGFFLITAMFTLILSANVLVTVRVRKCDYYDPRQKHFQYGLIWLIPVLGALVCYLFVQDSSGTYSGKYGEDNSLYDDGNVGIENANIDYFGGGHHGNSSDV